MDAFIVEYGARMSLFEGLLGLGVYPFSAVEATRPNSTAESFRHKIKLRTRRRNGSYCTHCQGQPTHMSVPECSVSTYGVCSAVAVVGLLVQVVTCGENRAGHSNF